MKKRTVEGGGYSGRGMDGMDDMDTMDDMDRRSARNGRAPLNPRPREPALLLPRVTSRLPARGLVFQGWRHYVRFPNEN
ncbi:hypothetical protein CVU37_01330 [candidate division BRC1 bacterium HGW-BRC1-1]|nr:MAG: hypothetical protein CVU37_01330 [candidate division BRC1 bacterium HGW-BRC1-1]